MTKTFFLLLTALAAVSAIAQPPATTPASPARPAASRPTYSADSFLLRSNGPRISLYSFCPAYGEPGRAVYFRKDQDSAIHRVTMHNLRVALADNPNSMQQLRVAGTNIYLGIGLALAGIGLTTAGIISTVHKNNEAQNAFNQATAKWYAQAQNNPYGNNPMPTLPHYSASPLIYIGAAATFTCMIPLFNVASHAHKAIDTYNGIN
jgi:hypothetical protein